MKTNKAFTHLILCLFSIFLIFLAIAQEQEMPANSISSEVSSSNNCAEGLVLITKKVTSELVCVKPETATKLIDRGWGVTPIAIAEITNETELGTSVEVTSKAEATAITKADRVFLSGAVYTVDESNPWAEAVAIQNGKITYVGDDEGAQGFIGEDTEVTNLTSKMLMPSFHDAHAHPLDMALGIMGCDLYDTYGKEEYLDHIAQCTEEQQYREIVIGLGFWLDAFEEDDMPNRHQLDELVPDKPATFMDGNGHAVWVNSIVLENAGIDKDTPDPDGGIIERDEDGEPTGLLHHTAMNLVPDVAIQAIQVERDAMLEAAKESFAILSSVGITSMVEAQALDESYDEFYRELDTEGELNLRMDLALWFRSHEEDDAMFEELISRFSNDPDSRVNTNQVKLLVDATIENTTGAVLEPYYDENGEVTDNKGPLDF